MLVTTGEILDQLVHARGLDRELLLLFQADLFHGLFADEATFGVVTNAGNRHVVPDRKRQETARAFAIFG